MSEVALTRIPIFIFGVYIGPKVYQSKKVGYFTLVLSVLSLFLVTFDFDSQLVMRYINSNSC